MTRFLWADVAKSELRSIDREHAIQILKALADYARTGIGDIKQLQGSHEWRLRIGDYRVRFELGADNTLHVLHVKHRRDAYR